MMGENAVANDVHQHPFGAIGGDVGEPIVEVLAMFVAEFLEAIEEKPREQADADAKFEHINVGFEIAGLLGFDEAREENLGGVSR